MKYIQGTDCLIDGPSVITLGKFDGMHKGHQELLHALGQFRDKEVSAVVFTFGTSPYELLRGTKQQLMTNEEKEAFCEAAGADYLIEYPFTDDVCHMSPRDFVEKVLVKQLHVRYLIVGTDFAFGYKRQGNVELLKELGKEFGYQIFPVEKLKDETGREISSTYIKEELAAGHMGKVEELSGKPYEIQGEIVRGNQLGRQYGIPTINVTPDPKKLLPPNGVYVSRVFLREGIFYGITNVGVRPTVSTSGNINLETFLFDFTGEIYGECARVQLLYFVRPERKFESMEELEKQIRKDGVTAMEYLKERKAKEEPSGEI